MTLVVLLVLSYLSTKAPGGGNIDIGTLNLVQRYRALGIVHLLNHEYKQDKGSV